MKMMKRVLQPVSVLLFLVFSVRLGSLVLAQSRGGNWPAFGGDAQHSGWEGGNTRISKDTVKDLQLLFKVKLEVQPNGLRSLLPPLILGRLISYRGFKELAFVGSNADIIYAIDADLGTIFWQKHLEYAAIEPKITASTSECPGGMTAMPAMPVPGVNAPRGAAARGAAGNGFVGGAASVYAISSDGRLHRLNTSTGDDMAQPVKVLPANSMVSALTLVNDVLYAATSSACNGTQDAVWAINLGGEAPTVKSFALTTGNVRLLGAPAIGADGTVHVWTSAFDTPVSPSNTLYRLNAGDLTSQSSTRQSTESLFKTLVCCNWNAVSPLVFQYRNRELIVTADGNFNVLWLWDSASPLQPASATEELSISGSAGGYGVFGNLSTWQDAQGVRWIFAPVWGRLNPNLRIFGSALPPEKGAIVAFKVEDRDGKPALTPAWVSRDMDAPLPPVVSNGVLFALSAGEITRKTKASGASVIVEERPTRSTRATLFALDAATGRELYSSQRQIHAQSSLNGITVANGRVYFGTTDGTFYGFGMYMEH